MKKVAIIVAFCILHIVAFAQNKIIVQGNYPDLYITHKVAAKQSLTSIGRLYNLTPSPLAKLNNINSNGLIAIGRPVKIPLTKNNFTQDGQQAENETLVPIFHIVQKNENLFRISQAYGKVRIDFLREWNDLNNDVIQFGQKITIGHLKISKENAMGINASTPPTNNTDDDGYGVKEEEKTEPKKEPEITAPTQPKPATSNEDNDTGEGFFVTQYPFDIKGKHQQIKTGPAATFKTTSGWSDKKYYVLMNDIVPGTIVRITGPSNKSVCAKVLGALPDMKENNGLLTRMSNATASALHISDALFQVQVSFFK